MENLKLSQLFLYCTVLIYGVISQCGDHMNCDNINLIPASQLGLVGPYEVDGICRPGVLSQLKSCLQKESGTCSFVQRSFWEPALNALTIICQNTAEYKRATGCYYDQDAEDEIDICSEDLEMTCGSFNKFKQCIGTGLAKIDNYCKQRDTELMGEIFDAYYKPFLLEYKCLPDEATTTTTTTTTTTLTSQMTTTSRGDMGGETGSEEEGKVNTDAMTTGNEAGNGGSVVQSCRFYVMFVILMALCYNS